MPFDQNALAHPAYVAPANPLEMAAGALQFQNALTGYKSRQAVGRDLAQATGADGSIDQGKFRALAAADPDAAYALPEAVSRSQEQQSNDLSIATASRNAIGSVLSFVGQNPDAAHLQMGLKMAKAVTPRSQWGQVDAIGAQIAQHPDGIVGGIKQVTNSMQSAPGQEANVYGTAGATVNNGQQTIIGTQGSAMNGGQFTPDTTVQQQTTPEFNAHPVPIVAPDGSTRYVTQGQVVSGAQGKPTVPVEAMGDGRYPQQAPDQNGPGFVASPAAGQVEAQKETATAGAQGANALMQGASGARDRLGILGNMLGDLTQFKSGPGYERLRHLQAFVNNVVPGADWNSSGVEGAQSFNKFANQIAQAQAQTLGVGSDAKLASAMHANPNSSLQTDTNRQMLHVLQGNEDAINSKAQAWQSAGLPASQYQQWNQRFNQTFDPRAYQLRRMTPEEQHNMISAMKKSGELSAFKKSYNAMAAQGLLSNGD
ncbi:hypothetical protein [Kozakia baliensis]|uniref:hypothetical protein n=1 Tax=Kozakia baliensis TaxID=153496 RepID=UPI00049758B7|nr:hypothetical protein [Kozakia baliensis]